MNQISLTPKQKKMIAKALDFYGNKIADSEGYTSAEPYWDLKEKIINPPKVKKKTQIDTVSELYKFATMNSKKSKSIVAILPDKTKITISRQFYIEDDIYYMGVDTNDKTNILTPLNLITDLLYENENDCWQKSSLDGSSSLGDCDVKFINGELDDENKNAQIYKIANVIKTKSEYKFIMKICN